LLAVASSKALIAAAGHDTLIIASTTSIRDAWASGEKPENNVKPFSPETKIPVPRLSHVAFSADEKVLVIVAEDGGGLAAYNPDALAEGRRDPALQVSTNGRALRALVPNPNVQFAELFAAVTRDGELLMADLTTGQMRNGAEGPVLRNGVSCLSWSNQGKQLVAGLADGTAIQMTPDGTEKGEIPRPPTLEGDKHVSTLSWLSNDTFLIMYSFNSNSEDMAQPSDYFVVSRQPKTQNYTFQVLPEVCPAFGLNRSPACQFVARLRGFEPHLEEILLLASTTSIELGLITKADAPLSAEVPVTDSYTLTMPADDSRRAQLPLSLTDGDTSPIGFALDLSAKDSVVSPLPSDPEIEESPGPLPSILTLNNEGLLSSWWIVYADALREKKTYSGLAVVGASEQMEHQITSSPASIAAPPPSALGQPAFRQPGFGQSAMTPQQPFAKPATSTFGGGSDAKFGAPATLSGDKPSWTSTGFGGATSQAGSSGFGQPGFGTSTPMGGIKPAFAAPTPFGGRPAFGQPAAPTTAPGSGTGFGQSGALGPKNPNPFARSGSASPFGVSVGEGKGFASFSNKGGFAALGSNQDSQSSPFGKGLSKDSAFAQPQQPSPFAPRGDTAEDKSALSGSAGQDFSLKPTFRPDETSKNDESELDDDGDFFFEKGLGNALDQTRDAATPAQSKEEEIEEEMEDDGGDSVPSSPGRGELAPLPPDPEPRMRVITPPPAISQPETRQAPLPSDPEPQMPVVTSPSTTSKPEIANAPLLPDPKTQMPVVTPPSTISQPKNTPAPPLAGLFSTETQPGTTPAAVQNSKPGWSFEHAASTTPKETPNAKPFTLPATPNDDDHPPNIKTESPSEGSPPDLQNIPEAPLPPDPTSKSRYDPGDTPDASDESKLSSNDDAPLPPDFIPKKSDTTSNASQVGPTDEEGDDFSSDFEGSVEDETHEISPIEEPTGDQAEQIQTSPESSFGKGGEGSGDTSPAGGLFTKVSTSKPPKLFGEVTSQPILPPPMPQESPRSPSPVRNVLTADMLRPETSRSVSAPTRAHSVSAIERRRAEIAKSALGSAPITAIDTRDKELERKTAAEKAKAKAEAEAALRLEDDEDARLRAELEAPLVPSELLEPFVPHQHTAIDDSTKSGIPGQIERLYQDINAMIDTLGINARSLSAYILYQTSQKSYDEWPQILGSDTPRDALNDEWVLQDITRLGDGEQTLSALLDRTRIDDVSRKYEQCQKLLNRDLVQLKTKVSSTRKVLRSSVEAGARASAPLSAEQESLQHDLRKASTLVQNKLVEMEQELTVLRAKLAEARPLQPNGKARPQRKPTVEAVTSTIAKMTSMAEKKSTDIDVLEAQLRNLGLDTHHSPAGSRHGSVEPNGTPQRSISGPGMSLQGRTPLSGSGSVYHTPDSRWGESTRSTPATWRRNLRTSIDGNGALVSVEDSERWKEKARRRKEAQRSLKEALAERRRNARTAEG
jgi:nucleoporin NUP159